MRRTAETQRSRRGLTISFSALRWTGAFRRRVILSKSEESVHLHCQNTLYRRALAVSLALLLLLSTACMAEMPTEVAENPDPVEEIPAEADEFDLDATEPEPEATPAPSVSQTPLPTLEPGSINYPKGKVNFENEIWTVLTRGWSLADYQAAGLMSSLYAESSFCPYNAQGIVGVDDRGKYDYHVGDAVGFGLCQWTSVGRKSALQSYAKAHGDANLVWDFDIQMGYMRSEINLSALKATQTLYEAAEWAVLVFERPNQNYANSWPGTRYDIALDIYKAHTGTAYEEPPMRFAVNGVYGVDPKDLELDGETAVTVESNYYWRLTGVPDWLKVERRTLSDGQNWEKRPCGYLGETALRFTVAHIPLLREARLTFEIYRARHATRTMTVRYVGPSVQEVVRARTEAWLRRMANARF